MQAERPRLRRKYPLLFHLVLLVVTCVLPVVGFSAMLMDRIFEEQWRPTGLGPSSVCRPSGCSEELRNTPSR
jgi:hypothetical protein